MRAAEAQPQGGLRSAQPVAASLPKGSLSPSSPAALLSFRHCEEAEPTKQSSRVAKPAREPFAGSPRRFAPRDDEERHALAMMDRHGAFAPCDDGGSAERKRRPGRLRGRTRGWIGGCGCRGWRRWAGLCGWWDRARTRIACAVPSWGSPRPGAAPEMIEAPILELYSRRRRRFLPNRAAVDQAF